jgi:hypothetical protein
LSNQGGDDLAANDPPAGTEVLDATIPEDASAPTLASSTPQYNPDRDREGARRGITYWLLSLLTLLIVISFAALIALDKRPTFDEIKSLVELMLGPLVALVSAATGFYFGAHSAKSDSGKG